MPISRRALFLSSAGAALALALPPLALAATPNGGRLIVAADSEPSNLNPAIVASNGVFFVASKIVEPLAEADYNGPDGLVLGSLARRQDRDLQAAP
jgi:peptide/nickel transport system substrate-binding protein